MTGPALAPRDVTATIAPPDPHIQAKAQLEQYGIPMDQVAKAYKSGISEALYRNITPISYNGHEEEVVKAAQDYFNKPSNHALLPIVRSEGHRNANLLGNEDLAKREDAWRLYLGLPQENKTFSVSPFKPSKGKDDAPYYYSIPDFEKYLIPRIVLGEIRLAPHDKVQETPTHVVTKDYDSGVMGNYTVSKGKDELGHYISYYDKWDLAADLSSTFAGHPYEIYGRVYYDPETLEKIPTEKVMWEKSKLDDSHRSAVVAFAKTLMGSQ